MATWMSLWPANCISSFVVAPLIAAMVAAKWRRSWKRKSGRPIWWRAFFAWEHQRVRSGGGEDRQVLADVLGEVRWQVDGPVSGGGLRCGDESLPTDSDGGLLNGDGPFAEVEVAAPQGGEFTEPQSAPRGEQDQQPVPRGHRIRECLHLGDGKQGHIFSRCASGGTFDGDRGLFHELACDGRPVHGLEQGVGVAAHGGG